MSVSGTGPIRGPIDASPSTPATSVVTPADATPAPTVARGGVPGRPVIGLSGPETAKPRQALGVALTNDHRGIVSVRDARNVVAAGLEAIAESSQPREVFEAVKRVIAAARLMVGHSPGAARELDSYEVRGARAVDARLSELAGGATVLPTAAQDAFIEMITTYETGAGELLAEGTVTIKDVQGDRDQGFTFTYTSDRGEGTAFAIEYGGQWFLAPRAVDRADLDAATAAWSAYFDSDWERSMLDWGATPDEITAARDGAVPRRLLWPGESDPYDFASSYPMVFEIVNASGSDHGFFVGYDPATGATEAYDFN